MINHGRVVHGELFAGDQSIWLHPSGNGYLSPRELGGVSSMIVIAVDDADAHYAYTRELGADILNAPVDQPYGGREYGARDLEGHLWFFHIPLALNWSLIPPLDSLHSLYPRPSSKTTTDSLRSG